MKLKDKTRRLEELLKSTGSCAVAFSGGTDSSLLLSAALRFAGSPVLAVTAAPPYAAESELTCAQTTAAELGARHLVLPMKIPRSIRRNPENRCYLCKKEIFNRIKKTAEKNGIYTLCDGSNADDLLEYRPGLKALKELGVISPLAECGFTKADVRLLSREWGIRVWDKPSNSCLLTRLPYNSRIIESQLDKIEIAEEILKKNGFSRVRVRCHDNTARIELMPDEIMKFCTRELFSSVDAGIRELGYSSVSLDLRGYLK